MVTQCETPVKKHAAINLYAGIFDSKLFRGGGRRNVDTWPSPESIREDAVSDRGQAQVENWSGFKSLHEDAPSDGALFHTVQGRKELSFLDDAIAAKEEYHHRECERTCMRRHKADSELEPISDFYVADIEKEDSQLDVIGVPCDVKNDLRAITDTNNGLNRKKVSQPYVTGGKKNLQSNVGSRTVNTRCNVGHCDHDNINRFPDVSHDSMESKNLQGNGPYLSPQSMQRVSKKAQQRVADVNASTGLVAGVPNDFSATSTPSRNGIISKNLEGWQSQETSSTSIRLTKTPVNPRKLFASVNELHRWEQTLDSTAALNGHASTLHERPRESQTFSSDQSNVDVSAKSLNSGEMNAKKVSALNLSRTRNSGEMSLDCGPKAYKSGEQELNGRGDVNGLAWKESPSRGHPLVAGLRIGERVSFDSSSSYGGSSSGGSPMASEAQKDGRVVSSGNILVSKGSPYSTSSRSMGSGTGYGNTGNAILSPTSSNGSPGPHFQWGARKSDEMVLNRKPGDIVHSGFDNVRGVGTYRMRADGMSNSCTNMGNLTRGNNLANGNGNLGHAQGNLLNNGHLLVGGSNGNVVSFGGGTKANFKRDDAKQGTLAVDYRLMKRAQASSDPEEIKNAGNEYYKAGHFSEALTLYDRALALFPSNVMYRSNRAAALSALGRLGEAVKECEEAIRLDSSYARAHQRVASLYIRLGLIESAKKHLHAAGQHTDLIEVQRLENIEKHLLRCNEARDSGDWHTVIRESDAAVVAGADSAPQIFGFKSEALLGLHKLEHADSVCTIAQKIEISLINLGIGSPDPFLHLTRAQVDIALGRFEEAVGAAEVASRIDPSNARATALLRKARAVAQARATGNDLFKAGRLFEALALYTEGLESDPTNAVLLSNRAACRLKLGQWEKAVEDCDAALRVQPNYTKALLRRASCLTKLERWDDALQDYEILRRELPGDTEVARGFFDVQVAMKKSRGEEIYGMKFGGDVEEVTTDEQFRDVVSSPGLSVVQFITRWSDRCRELSPFINHLCRRHPCVNFVKVDVEDHPYLAKIESITFIPTFKIYKSGQKLKEILGPSQQSLEYAVQHYSL